MSPVTHMSSLLLPTEREPPGDAEAISHKLMVRAGLIRQVGSGLWSWLPAGWRVHQNVVGIIRSELNEIGAQEMLMPVLVPAELWKRSGRYEIDETFKLVDRKGAEMILSLSHEEVVTMHVAQVVRSYRDLPLMLYHFQTKERDEPRPRAGVLRTREFIMKDSYSFDRDREGLDASYAKHVVAYDRIFERCGLEFYRVESDVGMMGGFGAHEYMAPCPAGENDVALAPGYAANVEIASAQAQAVDALPAHLELGEIETPGLTTVAEVGGALGVAPANLIKAFPVVTQSRGLVMVFVRGDHRVNEIKLANALGEELRPAREHELRGPGGYLGPSDDVPSLYDAAITPGRYVAGGGREGYHAVVEIAAGERADVRRVEAGDLVGGHPITIERAIEVGNIFKLGTRYSEPLGATFVDENGSVQLVEMGSYGIGPARVAAAAVEQFADEKGISWPRAIAPYDVQVVSLQTDDEAAELARELAASGLDVLLDDRPLRPGEKFADAELLGVPLRLTLGKRGLEAGEAEAQARRGLQTLDGVALDAPSEAVAELWRALP